MTKENTQKPNKQLLSNLQSADSLTVIKTIEQLRESGNASYIPVLIEILHYSDNPEINSKIITLLSDLKHSDAISLITEAIQNEKYTEELKDLVAVCWENGLNFSEYLSLFVDLVIEQNFEVAFEAYTVIQNMPGKISQQLLDEQIDKIEEALPNASEQKKQLLIDIIDFLPSICG